MLNLLLYLWVICVAFGPAYNAVGDPGVFALMLAIVLLARRIKIDKKLITSMVLFAVLIAYKAIGIDNGRAISEFHSAYGVINTSLKLIVFAFFLQTIIPVISDKRDILVKLFNAAFHVSIVSSIVILFIVGRNTYRTNAAEGGILLAPQIYITISVFMIMALVYLIMQNKEKRGLRLGLVVLNFIYIFMSNYTTQLIFAVFGILLVLTLGSGMKKSNKIVIVGIIGLLIIIGIPMLPTIIESLSRTFFAANETVNVRLNEIVLLLRRESIKGSDLMGRFDLINMSWESFKSSPVFGIPFSRYNTVSTGLVVGGHSEWPDDLARFGIVGGVIFALFIVRTLRKTLYYEDANNRSFKFAIAVMIILYGFSNPIIRYMEFEFFFLIAIFVDSFESVYRSSDYLWKQETNRSSV